MTDKKIMLNRIIDFYVGRNDLKETEIKTILDLKKDLEAINYIQCCTTLKSEETMSFNEVKHLEYKHNVLNKVLDKQQDDFKLEIFENGEWV